MLFLIATLLSLASLAAAPPPAAQATYCSEDNLLRAFQHTLTKAATYCATPTGYPTFLAVKSYLPPRLSSACSCLSRFPTDPTVPAPCAPNTAFRVVGTVSSIQVDIVFTVGTQSCMALGQPGVVINNACGTIDGSAISFSSTDAPDSTVDCYALQGGALFNIIVRTSGGDKVQMHLFIFGFLYQDLTTGGFSFFDNIPTVTDVSCTSAAVCAI